MFDNYGSMPSPSVREYRISNAECRTAEVLRNSPFVIRHSAVHKAARIFFHKEILALIGCDQAPLRHARQTKVLVALKARNSKAQGGGREAAAALG